MSLSISDIAIHFCVSGLTSLAGLVEKTKAHAEAKKIDPNALLDARLYPDMFPFKRQIQIATDGVRRGLERLGGKELSSVEDTETTFDELKARIESTIALAKGVDRGAIDESETREFTANLGQEITFTGRTFLMNFMAPNFFFHLTTAYDILRHNGVELGKRDFLGPFMAPA